jgi:crossover junction endodeoxyribonuclease RuvC
MISIIRLSHTVFDRDLSVLLVILCNLNLHLASQASPVDKIILGIDPGTLVMGFGILHTNGTQIRMLKAGHLRMKASDSHLLRLSQIFQKTVELVRLYKPDELAIEAPFFAVNVQSLLKLGRAQGAAIAAALSLDIPVFEYLPKKVKQAVTGNGNASKQQVAAMLRTLLQTTISELSTDATDALGVAYCHFRRNQDLSARFEAKANLPKIRQSKAKNVNSWAQFLRSNPGREI